MAKTVFKQLGYDIISIPRNSELELINQKWLEHSEPFASIVLHHRSTILTAKRDLVGIAWDFNGFSKAESVLLLRDDLHGLGGVCLKMLHTVAGPHVRDALLKREEEKIFMSPGLGASLLYDGEWGVPDNRRGHSGGWVVLQEQLTSYVEDCEPPILDPHKTESLWIYRMPLRGTMDYDVEFSSRDPYEDGATPDLNDENEIFRVDFEKDTRMILRITRLPNRQCEGVYYEDTFLVDSYLEIGSLIPEELLALY